ncbi:MULTISPECIES: acetolactate synthase large subunit [unclassified Cytobacillus]|uniref:acetolactate synthase large subunit n=1 Tax=unclassified Cytobacillus TaxID=2675268 RepID=UPI00203B0914|nr:acetolactate synthase large subunit [Cytobacillus sp. AMY 15.2]MCM3091889.1 acetolactate synthase large subunit [Cytobacillus sp. AMY 15.2]
MKATDLLVQCLVNEGVEYIFGMVGKETLDLVHSLSKSKIKFVNVRHEQGAAFMADIYGRLSKKTGVCTATLGPGAANLLTGISSAHLDHSPVVAITGQAGFEKQHQESHQYIDIVKVFEPATKWSVQIKDAQTIPSIIRRAFRLAQMEKKGAVLIELPENLAAQMVPKLPLPVTPIPTSTPGPQALESVCSLLGQYQKPLVITGNGVIRQGAIKELATFAEKLKSPVIHSFMAKGVLPKDHPQNFFTFGLSEQDEVLPIIEEADLLIVIGYDFVEKPPKDWNKKQRPVLHIDSLPAEMDEYYPLKGELAGDLNQTLQELNKLDIPSKPWVPAGNVKEQIKFAYQIDTDCQKNQFLTISNVLKVIETISTEPTIILSDVGAHKISIARTFQPKQAGRLIISNGLASMGVAIPGSIGAKLACPDAPVICITGDGGALMNITELETAKRLGLSFVIIVLNNGELQLEKQMMQAKFNSSFGAAFGNPDFVQLASSFGVKGIRPKQLNELQHVLEEAIKQTSDITLIDVQMDG